MSYLGRVLVTGASGFIGARMVANMQASGIPVFSLSRDEADLTKAAEIKAALDRVEPDTIFHLASAGVRTPGLEDERLITDNVSMIENLLNAVSSSMAIVTAGSMAEYGRGGVLAETTSCTPTTAYARSKFLSGMRGVELAAAKKLKLCHARLFHVFGPGEPSHRMLPALIHGLSKGRKVPLSDGMQARDFIHVDDGIQALVALALTLQEGRFAGPETVNVGTGVPIKIADVARWVARSLHQPESLLGFGVRGRSPADEDLLVADIRKFRNLTGYSPPQRIEQNMEIASLMSPQPVVLQV